jgi:hypothetical protein
MYDVLDRSEYVVHDEDDTAMLASPGRPVAFSTSSVPFVWPTCGVREADNQVGSYLWTAHSMSVSMYVMYLTTFYHMIIPSTARPAHRLHRSDAEPYLMLPHPRAQRHMYVTLESVCISVPYLMIPGYGAISS